MIEVPANGAPVGVQGGSVGSDDSANPVNVRICGPALKCRRLGCGCGEGDGLVALPPHAAAHSVALTTATRTNARFVGQQPIRARDIDMFPRKHRRPHRAFHFRIGAPQLAAVSHIQPPHAPWYGTKTRSALVAS